MSDRNFNPKVTYMNYIFNSFFTFDNNLHTIQASDARQKNQQNGFCLSFYIF